MRDGTGIHRRLRTGGLKEIAGSIPGIRILQASGEIGIMAGSNPVVVGSNPTGPASPD